jgi:hypothetical protein
VSYYCTLYRIFDPSFRKGLNGLREEKRIAELFEAERNKPAMQQTVGGTATTTTDWSQKAVIDEDEL